MVNRFELDRDVALVTGASRGIGAAIAARLAQAGARVVGTATTPEGAEHINRELSALGGRGVVLDIAAPGQVAAVQADIEGREGVVTVLVNNAGITRDNLLLRMKDSEWDAVLATNLGGTFHVTRAFLRGMIKARRGRVVCISSVVGHIGNAGQTNYAATKAGLEGFSRSLAREVASRGITVNVVAPGFIATDMTASLDDAQREKLLAQVPLQRLGAAEEVADAVLFLVAPSGSYVTGETIHVNGGLYMG